MDHMAPSAGPARSPAEQHFAAGGELTLGMCPFLSPTGLCSAAATSRAWRHAVSVAVAAPALLWCRASGDTMLSSVPSSVWAHLDFLEALEANSMKLCRLAACSLWFDVWNYELAFLVVGTHVQELLRRGLAALAACQPSPGARLPPLGVLPPEEGYGAPSWASWPTWGLSSSSAADASTAAVGASGCRATSCTESPCLVSASELRRLWASAYVGSSGDYDLQARSLAHDTAAAWDAIRLLAHLEGEGMKATSFGSSNRPPWRVSVLHPPLRLHRDTEGRGPEKWTIHAVALSSQAMGTAMAAMRINYYARWDGGE
eukprot:gnl/TRDRNA2_/TRDRNA2_163465_c1_seq1.p1 gnl/TRDRNA2_/TRDRNA2_163465_c1~~gnl/TRDRNA2_/TRDRNA2_163465_c1_seq1.p1  ORF type:complete len:316 (-),score=38.39 gnl/TRDRNA2_/TRDRNA2_163465_c1_seq1:337-1284(-)